MASLLAILNHEWTRISFAYRLRSGTVLPYYQSVGWGRNGSVAIRVYCFVALLRKGRYRSVVV